MPVYDGIEFEVVFDGAHRHCDADLLTAPALPAKSTPRPVERTSTDVVFDALPPRDQAGATVCELMVATQLTHAAVQGALFKLRHWGRCETTKERSYMRAPQRYWRSRELSANETIVRRATEAWLRTCS
jgi:hypothetical protein